MSSNLINKDNLQELLDFLWEDEHNDFCRCYSDVLGNKPKDMEMIEWCEVNGFTNHIFYNLLVIKQELNQN